MVSNDTVILAGVLDDWRKRDPTRYASDSDLFQQFCCEQVLKDYDLSIEQLEDGLIDGGDDGGIDGFFMFLNGDYVEEDAQMPSARARRTPRLEVFLFQAKNAGSFSETPFDRARSTVQDLFSLSHDLDDHTPSYNSRLIEKARQFRDIFMGLVVKHVELTIRFTYASRGDIQAIHHKVRSKARALEQDLSQLFTDAAVACDFLGAKELVASSRKQKTYTLQLHFIEQSISRDRSSYVVLCRLTDYYRFISDEDGHLRRHIFESNVRDYQGDVEVNQDIRRTLANPLPEPVDFWWLNNGITVLCSYASVAGKTLFLDDVQVVNGLQTSREIYEYLGGEGVSLQDDRSVLIRVVATDNPDTIDLIIKATNRQTAVPSASLRATDAIQRHIEDYFLRADWFYDRRKNYYKNLGKPSARVVGIPYLAQSVMAIVLREPDNSRARPSTLIKDDEEYRRVFDPQRPLAAYLFCAQMMKEIDRFLRAQIQDRALQIRISNFRFHLAMLLIARMLRRLEYRSEDVERLVSSKGFGTQADLNVPNDMLADCAAALLGAVDAYVDSTKYSEDKVAKSSEFLDALSSDALVGKTIELNACPENVWYPQ